MCGEVEQSRVEADRVAVPLQHGTAQIVVQNDPWDAVPCSEGAEMTAQKILHAGIEEKAQKYVPREAEHHDERHQGATGSTNDYVTKMTPLCRGPDYAEYRVLDRLLRDPLGTGCSGFAWMLGIVLTRLRELSGS
jgi:hypothetical protein